MNSDGEAFYLAVGLHRKTTADKTEYIAGTKTNRFILGVIYLYFMCVLAATGG